MHKLNLSLLLVALTPALARADALDKRRLPAEVRWFAHLDIESLGRSTLAQVLREQDVDPLAEVEELTELGLDFQRDLRSATVLSFGAPEAEPVILLSGTAKLDGAIAKLAARPEHRLETLEGRSVHAWVDGDEAFYAWVGPNGPSGSEGRLVVQSSSRAQLALALAVIEGKAPNLAAAEKPAIAHSPSVGSILFIATTTELPGLDQLEEASAIVRLAQSVVFDLGEAREALYADLFLGTKTEEEAQQLQAVMQGALAMLALMQPADPASDEARALREFTSSFRFTTQGKLLRVDFDIPVRLLLEALTVLRGGEELAPPATGSGKPGSKDPAPR